MSAARLGRLLGAWTGRGPAYADLAAALRLLLLDGRVGLGVELPSERELALVLRLSRTTVASAYALLREEGHLTSRRGARSRTSVPPPEDLRRAELGVASALGDLQPRDGRDAGRSGLTPTVRAVGSRVVELAYAETSLGTLTLRRRTDPQSGAEVHEVRIDDDYLMSSLFTVAEVALADLALARLPGNPGTVVVGGLGLGFTAAAALADPRVAEVLVVEALGPVIAWHADGLVPGGLAADPRCTFVHGDFFALVRENGFDPADPGRRVDAVLLDVDHSPRHPLTGAPRPFYERAGTLELAGRLRPGGVFGLWSDDPPDEDYLAVLREVFGDVAAEVVRFPALDGTTAANTVYLGTAPS